MGIALGRWGKDLAGKVRSLDSGNHDGENAFEV